MPYWNEIFKMFIPTICWLYGNCLVNTTLWICWHYLITRQRNSKSLIFSHYVALIKPEFHGSPGVFLYVRNSLHSCIYFFFAWYYKIVWTQVWAQASQIFVCGGLGNVPQKIFAQRKFSDKLSLYQWKPTKDMLYFKALSIMKVVSLTIQLNPIEKQS